MCFVYIKSATNFKAERHLFHASMIKTTTKTIFWQADHCHGWSEFFSSLWLQLGEVYVQVRKISFFSVSLNKSTKLTWKSSIVTIWAFPRKKLTILVPSRADQVSYPYQFLKSFKIIYIGILTVMMISSQSIIENIQSFMPLIFWSFRIFIHHFIG